VGAMGAMGWGGCSVIVSASRRIRLRPFIPPEAGDAV